MSSDGQYRSGDEVVPGYTLVQRLGGGMSGDVWVARGPGGTYAAVKVVRSLSMVGGSKELAALKVIRHVHHPNLCPLHGFWTKDVDGRLLEDGEIEAVPLDSSVIESHFDLPRSTGPGNSGSGGTTGRFSSQPPPSAIDPTATFFDEASAGSSYRSRAEQLIVVMGLGDCTLYDRLMQVRHENGLPKSDMTTCCGLNAAEAIRYMRAAASAIDLLNLEHNIYHCDLKPQNILLVGGEAQVCDFGLANRFRGDTRQTRQAFGSPAYAAPEVLQGKTYTRTVDQYSLALTYFEMRTGLLPFNISTEANITIAKCSGRLDLENVTSAERKVLKKAMSVDPTKRYFSCTEFVRELAVAAKVDQAPQAISWRAVLIAASVLFLLGVGFWVANRFQQSKRAMQDAIAAVEEYDKSQAVDKANPAKRRERILQTLEKLEAASSVVGVQDRESIDQSTRRLIEDLLELTYQVFEQSQTERRNQAESIDEDLDFIERLVASSPNVLTSGNDSGTPIDVRVDIARLLNASNAQNANQGDQRSRSAALLRTQFNAEPTQLGDKDALAAVAVSLMHVPDESVDPYQHFINESRLADLANAERRVGAGRSKAYETLPEYCQTAWYELQYGTLKTKGFKEQIKQALDKPDTPDGVRQIIENGWPDIHLDIAVIDLKTQLEKSNWDAFSQKLATVWSKSSTSDKFRQRLQIFKLVDQALGSKSDADQTLTKLTAEVKGQSGASSYREALTKVVAETLQRNLGRHDFDQTKTIYRVAFTLLDSINAAERQPAQSFLIASALAAGPAAILDSEIQNLLKDKGPSQNGPLLAALELETAALQNKATGRIQNSTKNSLAASGVESRLNVKPLPSHYYQFVLSLLSWFEGDQTSAAKQWKELQDQPATSATIREALGLDRCRWIANALLDVGTRESSVRDEEVLQQRFVSVSRGMDRTDQAAWWIAGKEQEADTISRRVDVQRLLSEIANRKMEERKLTELKIPLSIANPWPADETQVNDKDGQLYRALLAIALEDCHSTAPISAPSLERLLRSANAVMRVGRLKEINDTGWVTEVLKPCMEVLQRISRRSSTEPTGWQIDVAINPSLLRSFCEFYQLADENEFAKRAYAEGISTTRIDDGATKRLSGIEFSAAFLAQDSAKPLGDRIQLFLKATDVYQRLVEAQRNGWNDPSLKYFENYVTRALALDPKEPSVVVQAAFVDYYKAKLSKDPEELRLADGKLDIAIRGLEKIGQSGTSALVALYNANWRRSNLLVLLAFLQDRAPAQQVAFLQRAIDSARLATGIVEQENLPAKAIVKNAAYMSLGNSCEDMAYYGRPPREEREKFYLEAIKAFQTAIYYTDSGDSAKAQFSMARCIYRYVLDGGTEKSIEQAIDVFKELKPETSLADKVEWYLWRAQVYRKAFNFDEAKSNVKTSYDLVEGAESDELDPLLVDEVVWLYADVLKQRDNDRLAAIEALKVRLPNSGAKSRWKYVSLLCECFALQGDYTTMMTMLNRLNDPKFMKDPKFNYFRFVEETPKLSLQHIAKISIYVQFAGFPEVLGATARVDTSKARELLEQFVKNLSPFQSAIDGSETAITYSGFIEANAYSLSDQPLGSRVLKLLTAINAAQIDPNIDNDMLIQMKLAIVGQFQAVFYAPQRLLERVIGIRDGVKVAITGEDRRRLIATLASIPVASLSNAQAEDIREIKSLLP